MIRVLGLVLIFVTIGAKAAPQLMVNVGQNQDITCQQKSKSNFWVCDGDRLLFFGEPSIGQTPTVHDLKQLNVKIPNRVTDLETNKVIFANPLDFQYQQPGRTAADSYYRKANMMMSFEPRLRACSISECRKLKALLHALVYRQNQLTASQAFDVNKNVLQQVNVLNPTGGSDTTKTFEQMKIAYAVTKNDTSLRYDYLRDGYFARAEIVASQLAAKGFEVYKIWVHGFSLWSYHNQKPSDLLGWSYYVAPLVRVNGELWVFDPGFFTTPVKPHQWVSEVFGPNQLVTVANSFVEADLAVKNTVAVSVTPWQVYPDYGNTSLKTAEEISADIGAAQSVIDELGLY